jgi:hypothetical protein
VESAFNPEMSVWGSYPNYQDIARFEYGRLLWRVPEMRERLLSHWLDPRHPHRERFGEHRALIEEVMTSDESLEVLDSAFRQRGSSLRSVVREIPPIFG